MGSFNKVVSRVTRIAAIIGGVTLIVIMLLIVANIIARLIGGNIAGTWELTNYMMVITIGFAILWTGLNRGQVVVTILTSRFPPRAQAVLLTIATIMCICILGLMIRAGVGWITATAARGVERTELLKMPVSPYKKILVSAFCIYIFILLRDLFQAARQTVKK